MKPKRTINEAFALYMKNRSSDTGCNYFDKLVGNKDADLMSGKDRVDSLGMEAYAPICGIAPGTPASEIFFPALLATCIDLGIVLGRLMYEGLPTEIEASVNPYIN